MKKLIITIALSLILFTGCLSQYTMFMKEPDAVKIGMTYSEVVDVWNRPQRINRTTTSYGTREQWVYSFRWDHIYETAYVYFENGKVTAIQN
jgi:uncharacterized lipoprotein YajG